MSADPLDFTLDPYAATSCPVKTQNAFLPGAKKGEARLSEDLLELFAGSKRDETQVMDALLSHCADGVDLRPLAEQPWAEQEAACLAAMDRGASLIVGGVLPTDRHGHRRGNADAWLRGADREDGTPGYQPVEVKFHRVTEHRMTGKNGARLQASTLESPSLATATAIPDIGLRLASRESDLLHIAHYWRVLQAAGREAGGDPMGALIGTDDLPEIGRGLIWVELRLRQLRTYSRTASDGWRLRSPLERHDHEHGFRCRVVKHAVAQDRPEPPPLLVRPIVVKECDRCPWWEMCRPQLSDADLSLRIDKSPLDVREISVLRSLGVETVEELAAVDIDAFVEKYLPEVRHRPGAEQRLRLAARRARMVAEGVDLERVNPDPITVPAAELESDFDIETSAADRVYLWGFWLHDTTTGQQRYIDFSAFADLSANQEIALAAQAMGFLRDLVNSGRTVKVYHYSDYETMRLRRLAARSGDEVLQWAVAWSTHGFVDLFSLVRQHFFGTHGLGLKMVAHQGAGFEWRDDDPGGLNSQRWFDEAVHSPDAEAAAAARTRVLEYNEDDVRATHALRAWLRSLD